MHCRHASYGCATHRATTHCNHYLVLSYRWVRDGGGDGFLHGRGGVGVIVSGGVPHAYPADITVSFLTAWEGTVYYSGSAGMHLLL